MKKLSTLSLFLVFILVFSPLTASAFTSECTGGTITHSGGKTIHTFTSSGTLDCTTGGSGNVESLVVAGGGGNAGSGGTGSQGSNGGSSSGEGAGGGGASAVGSSGGSYGVGPGGNGGTGTANSISGSSITYAGGGGGGTESGVTIGSGGTGGGGDGGQTTGGVSGTANTGGGGGGSGDASGAAGGAGGSGIVIISYTTPSSPFAPIIGSGTINRLAKFTSSTTIENALFSDDGFNTTLTFGNFFMPIGSLFDSSASGALSFGTTTATTMTFGRSGQNMIINSKVGIATNTPATALEVNGTILANILNVIANSLGLDTYTAGSLNIGSTTASTINIGHSGATTTILGPLKVTNLNTVSNCNSSATPAVCGSAPSGSVAMPTGGSTIVVNTTAVTANSQIFVTEDSSLGTRLGITCNTTTGRIYTISARTAGSNFTIKSSANPATNKACLSYMVVN